MQGRLGTIKAVITVATPHGIETHTLLVFIDGKLKHTCQHLSRGACYQAYKDYLEDLDFKKAQGEQHAS